MYWSNTWPNIYFRAIHRRTFTELAPNRTLIEDEVRYRLPLEPLGDIAHFFIKRELAYIFDFRQKAVAEILGNVVEGTSTETSQLPLAAKGQIRPSGQ
ncbi:hypothetical protein BH24ACI3_BH24ACI3_03080 [soil metagenome]